MKRLLAIAFAFILIAGCAKEQKPEQKPEEIWGNTYNGQLLLQLAAAHDEFESKGALPSCITWEGVTIFKQEYFRAGATLLKQMADQPKEWYKEDISYPSALVTLVSDDEPFTPKEIAFYDFEGVVKNQYKNMKDNGEAISRITVGSYEKPLNSSAVLTMICASCASYRDNGAFPEKIDTWETTYTVSTNNCDIHATEVKDARDAAWKESGVSETSTERDKAVAIFNYARDKWTWQDYYNTQKGAVGTIIAKSGNCCDLSHAIVAMARLSGIPSRYFHAQCKYSSGYIGHVISQLFVDGKWEYADASNDGNQFGTVSFTDYTNRHYYESLDF